MRTFPALIAFAAIASLSCALAQSDSVVVNPAGGRMLIDPATGKERWVPDLLEPWQSQPIRLHPPRKHHRAAPAAETATPSQSYAETPEAAPPPRKPKRTARVAPPPAAPPPQRSAPVSGFSDFTDLISPQPSAPPPPKKAAPRPVEPPKAAEAPPPRAEKPVQRASVEPPKPSKPKVVAGSKKDTITFAPNASDPSTSAVATIGTLAGTLNGALSDANARVQLMAYAGMRGEKSSDTRRLSLKRALVVRQLLIDDGVPAERIDVFALGGADDDGPLDRVDVFVKS